MNLENMLEIFNTVFFKMLELFFYMLLGFVGAKSKLIPKETARYLSILEKNVFLPAIALDCFLKHFTVSMLKESWMLLLVGAIVALSGIPLCIFLSKFFSNDSYLRKMYAYGICFANFGFMGKAIVSSIFPEHFVTYLVYLLPLEILLYSWGIPVLLMNRDFKLTKKGILNIVLNPTMICLLLGMVLGLFGVHAAATGENTNTIVKGVYNSTLNVISVCGSCMSPIAMLLTGITFASVKFKVVLVQKRIYAATFLRLIVIPLLFCGVLALLARFFDIPKAYFICVASATAMPLGLNSVVIPASYGADTTDASGMALISHTLSIITIPIVFSLFVA